MSYQVCVSITGTILSILHAKRVLSNVHANQCDSFIECSCQPLPKFHRMPIIAKALSSVNANHCDSFINYNLSPHIMNCDVILHHVLWHVTSSFMRTRDYDKITCYFVYDGHFVEKKKIPEHDLIESNYRRLAFKCFNYQFKSILYEVDKINVCTFRKVSKI